MANNTTLYKERSVRKSKARHRRALREKRTSPYRVLTRTTRSYSSVSNADNEHLLNLWRQDAPLRPVQRNYIWKWFDDFCLHCVARQFRKPLTASRLELERSRPHLTKKNKADIHQDRVLLCMDFFKSNTNKSIGWLMTAYRIRFALFESMRYLRGIGIEESDNVQSSVNIRYMHLLRLTRENYQTIGTSLGEIDYIQLAELYEQYKPSKTQETREKVMRQSIRLCSALAIAYPTVSLDDPDKQRYNTTTQGEQQ